MSKKSTKKSCQSKAFWGQARDKTGEEHKTSWLPPVMWQVTRQVTWQPLTAPWASDPDAPLYPIRDSFQVRGRCGARSLSSSSTSVTGEGGQAHSWAQKSILTFAATLLRLLGQWRSQHWFATCLCITCCFDLIIICDTPVMCLSLNQAPFTCITQINLGAHVAPERPS